MKNYFTIFAFLLFAGLATAQTASINEIHYDNAGADVGEMVEVFITDPQPGDLSMYVVELVNGSNGTVYDSEALTGAAATPGVGGTYYVINAVLQNGSPDGVAICVAGAVTEFLSYEGSGGSFSATAGCASGTGSTNIGAVEGSGTAVGTSIQKQTDGSWVSGLAATPGAENVNALPVSLSAFDVKKERDNSAMITWTTMSEENSSHFEVLESQDGRNFRSIGSVAAMGYSNSRTDYSFEHEELSRGMHYYQLKQVDLNGAYALYNIESINVDGNTIAVYPTMVKEELTIVGAEGESVDYEIYNALGRLVKHNTLVGNTINLANLAAGHYFIRVNDQTFQFMK